MRSLGRSLLTLSALAMAPTAARAQHNPAGWIQTSAWTMLLPLRDLTGCYGGGPAHMKLNRVAPQVIGTEDPRPGDRWEIDFGDGAAAHGFGGGGVFASPTWFTSASLEADLELAAGSLGGGDAVDFGAIVATLNSSMVPTLADPSPLPLEDVLAVATTYVQNDFGQPLEVEVCTASAASIQVWINHKCVTNVSACRDLAADCAERHPAILPVGVSKIAVLAWSGIDGAAGQWTFRLGLERVQDGHRYSDDDAGQLSFLGSGDGLEGQQPYCLKRSVQPFEFRCPVKEALVTLQGSGPGDADEVLTVTECIFVDHPESLEVTVVADPAESGHVTLADLILPNDPAVGSFWTRRVLGDDCGAASGTAVDGFTYSSSSTTGGAGPAEEGDDFEFAFGYYCGDFDLVVEITGRSLEGEGSGSQWGSFGLMVRSSLEADASFFMVAEASPAAADSAVRYRATDGGAVGASSFGAGAPGEAVFLRLTRRGSLVQAWVSAESGIGTGALDPCDDTHWTTGLDSTWDETTFEQLYVGFANFGGSGSDCPDQSVSFEIVKWLGCEVEVPENTESSGQKLTWTVPREVVDDGLQYRIRYGLTGSSSHVGYAESEDAFRPEARTEGIDAIPFNVTQTGPLGDFDNAHDIGDPPSPGSAELTTRYRLTSSGTAIGNAGDQFYFLYKEVTGDFEMIARLGRPGASGPLAGPHGLMARWTCDADSKFSMLQGFPLVGGMTADARHAFRLYHGVASSVLEPYLVDDCTIFGICDKPQLWMRLIRCGDTIYSYLPKDQTTGSASGWEIVGSDTDHDMAPRLLAGVALASTSGAAELLEVGSFSCVPFEKTALVCSPEVDPVIDETFDTLIEPLGDDAQPRFFQVQSDPAEYRPQLLGGRLRLTEQPSACLPPTCTDALDVANAVWFLPRVVADRFTVGKAAGVGFLASFGVHATHDGARVDPLANPAEGLTFVAMEVDGDLDLSTLVGDPGGALGYQGGAILEQVEGHASLAVEIDLHQDPAGQPPDEPYAAGSEDFDGEYHIAIDVNSSVSSLATSGSHRVGGLPDLFDPAGIDVEVEYQSGGLVTVRVSGSSFAEAEAVTTFIAPLESELVFGFTAATGERATRLEVDGFQVFPLHCKEGGSVTVEGPASATVGESVTLQAVASGFVAGATYEWTISAGPGSLAAVAGQPHRTVLTSTAAGTTVVQVTVRDGEGAFAAATHQVEWMPGLFKLGDANGDGNDDISDAVRSLGWLFLGLPEPPCLAAADVNSDGLINITDPISLLSFLFLGAAGSPGLNDCIADAGELGCNSHEHCQ